MAINICDELKNDFLVYAQEVNNNRAFADVRDGLKPSQRAGLWTMYNHGFSSDKPHVKSAKVTGAVIGEIWPHGDGSAYEAIVRMSQPWINNIPEIDWHGANGSLLGGPQAASSRYTECRLSESVEDGFFSNIKKDTVDFIPNFSEDMEWPIVFPAVFPRLFVNGSQGIGYTIAQEWECGNLTEFTNKVKTYIKTGKVDCSDIYPDYPTGGIIINKKDIHNIYETGKGTVILRGKTSVEGNTISITELPYQVYAEPLIAKIKELVNSDQLIGVEDICNKSGDDGLIIEIECSDNPEVILNKLYKLTDLQVSFSANQMALLNGVPEMFTLKDYIKTYIEHNLSCIKREYNYMLAEAKARQEIVDGLVKCIKMIDKVIDTIKKSSSSTEARANLIKVYEFTENQAKAIVDMRLGKLAHLESEELEKELQELIVKITNYTEIVKSETKQKSILTERLTSFTKKYGWARRTQVADIDIVKEKAVVKAAKVSNEQTMICLTKGNFIKRIPLVNYKAQTKVSNESDRITYALKVGVRDKVILISENGMMYKLQANKIPNGTMNSSGTSLTTLFNDKIIAIYTGQEEGEYLFFITQKGLAKKIKAQDVYSIGKNVGATIMKLDEDDRIIGSYNINAETVNLTIGTKQISIDTNKFKCKGRSAGGVKAVRLKNGETINANN